MSDTYPNDLLYTEDHEWARPEGNLVTVGISQFAVEQLGDVTQVDLPREGRFRISKRSMDFWFMVIVGNAVILGGAIAMQNTMSMVFGIGFSGLYTFGLLWSMYGVMDRY